MSLRAFTDVHERSMMLDTSRVEAIEQHFQAEGATAIVSLHMRCGSLLQVAGTYLEVCTQCGLSEFYTKPGNS